MTSPVVQVERQPSGVAVVTLDRPRVHNSFNTAMAAELLVVARELSNDEETGAVVVAGAGGKAFCAGADIAEFGALDTPDEFYAFISHLGRAVEAISELPQPVIAAVEGIAFGGGCELAMACDFRTASERTKFGLPEVKLGLLPGLGGTQRAIRLLPPSVALELLVTGEPLDAQTAHRLGFCLEPVEAGGALNDAIEYASRLCAGPRQAIAAAKQLVRDGRRFDMATALELEKKVGRSLFGSPDGIEGVAAFLQKRPAQFGSG